MLVGSPAVHVNVADAVVAPGVEIAAAVTSGVVGRKQVGSVVAVAGPPQAEFVGLSQFTRT